MSASSPRLTASSAPPRNEVEWPNARAPPPESRRRSRCRGWRAAAFARTGPPLLGNPWAVDERLEERAAERSSFSRPCSAPHDERARPAGARARAACVVIELSPARRSLRRDAPHRRAGRPSASTIAGPCRQMADSANTEPVTSKRSCLRTVLFRCRSVSAPARQPTGAPPAHITTHLIGRIEAARLGIELFREAERHRRVGRSIRRLQSERSAADHVVQGRERARRLELQGRAERVAGCEADQSAAIRRDARDGNVMSVYGADALHAAAPHSRGDFPLCIDALAPAGDARRRLSLPVSRESGLTVEYSSMPLGNRTPSPRTSWRWSGSSRKTKTRASNRNR